MYSVRALILKIHFCSGPTNCGTAKLAHVISTSYGYNEADLTPAYTARQCAEYGRRTYQVSTFPEFELWLPK